LYKESSFVHRSFGFLAASVFAVLLPLSASAQIAPHETVKGELRGIQDLSNSGQIGTAAFFAEGLSTRVQVTMRGVRAGRIEPLAIIRGKSCDEIEPTLGWYLNPLTQNTSTTLIPTTLVKVLSGNYVIVAHADDKVPGHNVACGELAL
jgi:hypothetical protein